MAITSSTCIGQNIDMAVGIMGMAGLARNNPLQQNIGDKGGHQHILQWNTAQLTMLVDQCAGAVSQGSPVFMLIRGVMDEAELEGQTYPLMNRLWSTAKTNLDNQDRPEGATT